MQQIEIIDHIVGATFSKYCKHKNELGELIDLTDVDIASKIKNRNGTFVQSLNVTKLNQITNVGEFLLSCNSTSHWPEGQLFWDIAYRKDGVISFTSKLIINVIRGISDEFN